MTMVEAVAAGLYAAWRARIPAELRSDVEEWAALAVDNRGTWLSDARAAIEAMHIPEDHEPMDRVVEAVQTEVDIWPEDKPKPSPNFVQFVSREEAIAIWNAGIDAALSEGDGA